MKHTYGSQTIDLFDKKQPQQILLSLSGGLDSASLLYLLLKYYPHLEIIPYTGRDVTAPFDYECTLDILSFMKETFPDANIKEQQVYTFDIFDPEWRKKAEDSWEEEKVEMPDGTRVPRAGGLSGLVKIIMMREQMNDLIQKFPDGMFMTGMTGNPPIEEQKKYGFYDVAERRRDDKSQSPWLTRMYQPYLNVDKKFVAGIYRTYDLMETLYPYTSSCVGFPDETNHYTDPCGKCFWCQEKKWAFET